MKTVREAAHALCDRWDMMQWKDAEHTSVFVRALRRALAQPEPVMDYDKEELRGTVWDTNKQSLAQPEQEPVAYREAANLANSLFKKHFSQDEHYASGRVVWGLCDTTAGVISQIDNMVCGLERPAITQPEQEPAMLDRAYTERLIAALEDNSDPVSIDAAEEFRRLLTSPKREWVGLTDEEVQAMDSGVNSISSFYAGALWANEKLKEKNT